jgi:hypothetical protein
MFGKLNEWIKAFWEIYGNGYIPTISWVLGAIVGIPATYKGLQAFLHSIKIEVHNHNVIPALPELIIDFRVLGVIALIITNFILMHGLWNYAMRLRSQIKGARLNLAELRELGVGLRNDGHRNGVPIHIRVIDETSYLDWKARIEKWNNDVIDEIKRISEADAIWFGVLDVMPPLRTVAEVSPFEKGFPYRDEHLHFLRLHDARVARLGEMIRELWGKI